MFLPGVGIHFGDMSKQGGRLVNAPLVESPAEAAGIKKGDRVLEIGEVGSRCTVLGASSWSLPACEPVVLVKTCTCL